MGARRRLPDREQLAPINPGTDVTAGAWLYLPRLDGPSKLERLRNIKANLERVYYPEPLKLSEAMKEKIRQLKAEADEKP